ncbi:MAG: hypothetical protein R3C18_20800 [Planctomycetaceae bacterium]
MRTYKCRCGKVYRLWDWVAKLAAGKNRKCRECGVDYVVPSLEQMQQEDVPTTTYLASIGRLMVLVGGIMALTNLFMEFSKETKLVKWNFIIIGAGLVTTSQMKSDSTSTPDDKSG